MSDKRKKLFLFDIDNTLYDVSNNVLPESTIKALRELKKVAHIGIATGRGEYMLHSIAEVIDLFDDFILINGQYIKSNSKLIYENHMNSPSLDKLVNDMDKLDLVYGFQGGQSEAIGKVTIAAKKLFAKLGLNLPDIDPEFYKNNYVYQTWVFADEKAKEILERQNPEFEFIRWFNIGYDILPKNTNKGQGVSILGKYLNIDPKDIISFGDGDNDIELLENSGYGIAMENATEELKKVADYITASVSDDGIYKALKYLGYLK